MNELSIFNSEQFGSIRTLNLEGEPWFVGRDVAISLGYAKPENALQSHVDGEDKTTTLIQGSGSNYKSKTTIINESGLYSLVLSSKLPSAKQFKRWITSEVIPTVRKTGAYMTPDTLEKTLRDPDYMIGILTALKEEQEKRRKLEAENRLQKQRIADYEPKAKYLDLIMNSTGTMTTSQIAADYDMSANKLNIILHDAGIQRKVNGQWILYREYMGKGYTKSITIPIVRSDGRPDTKMHSHWTQKGRFLIHEILTAKGITAVIDRI